MESSVAEREVLDDAVGVGFVHDHPLAKAPPPFWVFAGQQMTSASMGTEHLAARGDFESFGDRPLRFNAFGTTHKRSTFVQQERAIEEQGCAEASGILVNIAICALCL